MKPLKRRTLADEAAATLVAAIRGGTLAGLLPGYRSLCESLGISRSALVPALEKLVEEGWLISQGLRRRYVTNVVDEVQLGPGQQTRNVLLLMPVEHAQTSGITPLLSEPLRKRLPQLGWTIESRIVVVDQTRRHDRMWDQLLELHGPDALLLYGPHRTTAEWAASCGVPACAIGGDASGLPLSHVGFQSSSMIEEAMEHLLAFGHRDICLLVPFRTPGFVEKQHSTMERVLARHGIVFVPAWHAPTALHHTPEGIYELLERRFELSTPSAIIAYGAEGLQPAMGFLLNRGIAVPRDVSLVMAGDRPDLGWIKPGVACFDFPWPRLVNFLVRWLNASRKRPQEHEQKLYNPKWVEGASVAPFQPHVIPKKKK